MNVQQRGCACVHDWRGDEAVDVASFSVGGRGHEQRREGLSLLGRKGHLSESHCGPAKGLLVSEDSKAARKRRNGLKA